MIYNKYQVTVSIKSGKKINLFSLKMSIYCRRKQTWSNSLVDKRHLI